MSTFEIKRAELKGIIWRRVRSKRLAETPEETPPIVKLNYLDVAMAAR